MHFVIVVPADAQDAILVKNKSGVKAAAILLVWLQALGYFHAFF
jgi:hypothetical protein